MVFSPSGFNNTCIMLHISVTKRCLSRDWSILKCGGGKRVFLQDTWHSHFSSESNNK